jgi:hypothetical protein
MVPNLLLPICQLNKPWIYDILSTALELRLMGRLTCLVITQASLPVWLSCTPPWTSTTMPYRTIASVKPSALISFGFFIFQVRFLLNSVATPYVGLCSNHIYLARRTFQVSLQTSWYPRHGMSSHLYTEGSVKWDIYLGLSNMSECSACVIMSPVLRVSLTGVTLLHYTLHSLC